MNWLLDVVPAPRLLVLPPDAASLDEADAAIELYEHYTGKRLDPAQRLTVQVMMAQDAAGNWAASTTGREMPRQNGKGDEVEVVELWGLVQRGEAILHTIHDAVLLASQTQQRMLGVLESHADLRRRIKRVWKGTGQQMIEMRNGGTIWYRTRTGGGGRGVDDIDRLVIDEAQHATDEQLAAMTPTLLANANPQMNALGTAALEGKSDWWWQVRKRALSSDPGRFGYVGHTAEHVTLDANGIIHQVAPDPYDKATWYDANPALHANRGTGEAFFAEQLQRLGPVMFAQEHLGVWSPPPAGAGVGPIDLTRWNELTDGDSLPTDDTVRLALDMPPERRSATFSIAGKRPDNLLHVSQRRHVPPHQMIDLVSLAVALCEGHGCDLIIPAGSPALSWRTELESAGVTLDIMSPAETAAAFGYLVTAVDTGNIRHRGSPEMVNAVAGMTTKLSGDVEVPARRTSTSNIAPVIAAMCALYRVPTKEAPRVPIAVV